MSEVDLESQGVSEDNDVNNEKLVPVSEAIRYRKRAQNAEKEKSELEQELHLIKKENERINEQLKESKLKQQLISGLTMAGVTDLEAAVLMANARMKSESDNDIESVIEQLKKEKSYLFSADNELTAVSKTAGVKERKGGSQRVLKNAANRAAVSGSRTDVQEYMKVRRQFV